VDTLSRFTGHGILVAEHDEHKRLRKLLNPAFFAGHLKSLTAIFRDSARELRGKWREALDKAESASEHGEGQVDVSSGMCEVALYVFFFSGLFFFPCLWGFLFFLFFLLFGSLISFFALSFPIQKKNNLKTKNRDIIGRAGFGYDFAAVRVGSSPVLRSYYDLFSLFQPGLARYFRFLWKLPTPRTLKYNAARKRLEEVVKGILKEGEEVGVEGREERNLLRLVMQEGEFREEELITHVFTFLSAGHEVSILFFFFFLEIFFFFFGVVSLEELLQFREQDFHPRARSSSFRFYVPNPNSLKKKYLPFFFFSFADNEHGAFVGAAAALAQHLNPDPASRGASCGAGGRVRR
jgi:hypothetical protein